MLRRRDRYECVLENYPPLEDPTILAEITAQFLHAVNIAFSAFNISGTTYEGGKRSRRREWREWEGGRRRGRECVRVGRGMREERGSQEYKMQCFFSREWILQC